MAMGRTACAFLAATGMTGLLLLAGCGTNSATPQNGLTPGGAALVYSLSLGGPGQTSLLAFPLNGPSATLTPTILYPPDGDTDFDSVATDSKGFIYVGANDNNTYYGEVLVYSPGASYGDAPVRIISGDDGTSGTTFGVPLSISINSAGTLAILSQITQGYSVATLPASSKGTVTPTTLIYTNNNALSNAVSLTIDKTGNVYVSDFLGSYGAIEKYVPGANGPANPATTITTPNLVYGVGTDGSGNVYAGLDSLGSAAPTVGVYSPTANGAATPTRLISGAADDLNFIGGVRADAVGNVYVLNLTVNNTVNVLAFPAGATGNATPGEVVSSSTLSAYFAGAEIGIY